MKLNSFLIGAVSLTLLSGCIPAASENTTDGLTRADVTKIVQQEMAKSAPLTAEDVEAIVDQKVSEKVTGDALQMTDEDFNAKVAAGIDAYIVEQEEKARVEAEEANKPKYMEDAPDADDDPFLGDANAPVTIVEFSDFECPFCSRHVTSVYPQIKEKYIDTGKVKYVFRDLPLSFHPDAMPAAVAANCVLEQAGNEEYFEFHDKLFANQQGLNRDNFLKYAKDMDLDEDTFEACLDTNDTTEIEKDMADAAAADVTGTPGFFINGYNIKGAYPFETFEELIEAELAK